MKRIVVVDDSPVVLEATQAALEDAGFEVETVLITSMSTDFLFREADLFLLDVQLPEVYGDTLARFVTDTGRRSAPIYLYSALPEDELRDRAEDAGADGYICKGWGIERVVEEVEKLLGEAP